MSAIIYLLTNTLNGKQYVGQTNRLLETRWKEHCRYSRTGSTAHLHKAIRKYGADAFIREILEDTTDEDVNNREIYWIAELNTKEEGYNMTEGGEGVKGLWGEKNHFYGKTHSSETKAKIAAANGGVNSAWYGKTHSDETKKKMSVSKMGERHPLYGKKGKNHPLYGRALSEETKAKLRLFQTGKKHSNETKAKLREALKGRVFSEEHRAKLSAASKAFAAKRRLQKEAGVGVPV